jgi:hypothetical protein
MESGSQKHLSAHLVDFWLARGAILVIVGLQIGIVNDLTVGPRWFAPCLELALLIPLSIGTAWVQKRARKASTGKQWNAVGDLRRMLRGLAIILTAVITLMNSGALIRLVAAMLSGHAGTGRTLLLDSLNIWVTNMVPRQRDSYQNRKAIFFSLNNRQTPLVHSFPIGRPVLLTIYF